MNSVANVLFTQTVIDAVANGKGFKFVVLLICNYLGFLLVLLLLKSLYDILYNEKKNAEIQLKINLEVYNKILGTDYKFFDDPDFYNNFTWAINEYAAKSAMAYNTLMNFCSAIATIVSMVSIILIIGPWIVLITIIELIITVCFEIKRNKYNINKQERLVPIDRKLGYIHRVFYQREYAADVKSTRLDALLKEKYQTSCNNKLNVIKEFAKKIFIWLYTQNFIGVIYNGIIMAYISYGIIVTQTIAGVGKFMGLLSANNQLMTSLYGFIGIITQVNNLELYAKKIRTFFDLESKIENTNETHIPLLNKPFEIHINAVSFKYTNSDFALKDIEIIAHPGEKIAIVGHNGAGKSTLMKLLLRLYDPNNGYIFFNNEDIRDFSPNVLRKNVGVAFQSTNIYAMSLADNLRLYNELTEESIAEILNKLKFNKSGNVSNDYINSELTREFDENGIILSGGEMQKIGIGRILYGDFGLLLFDEPSASLDPISEYELTNIIFDKANESTTIFVAHRLSMVRKADKIYVMDHGKICECGTHAELMLKKGTYYEMFKKQAENYVD